MLFLADFAVGRRQRIVHPMVNGLHGAQVRIHRLQIIVAQVLEGAKRHNRAQFPRTHVARSQRFDESSFVVISDARWVRGDIGTRDLAPWPFEVLSATEIKLFRNPVAATSQTHEVLSRRHAVRTIWTMDGLRHGFRRAAHQV